MKKRYVLIPLACVLALVVIVIAIALALKASYLEKLSYDHMNDTVYNNVEIVGDEGLFYLVKDGKKASSGYVSLISVNDYYPDVNTYDDLPAVMSLYNEGADIIIYDYYIAREAENPNYIIIDSAGDKYTVLGENYSLSEVKLPYLIFVNNTNGRKAVLSLGRLDSDISFKSGSELTLRPFKNVTPQKSDPNAILYDHIITDDIADTEQTSCFRSDGIKIVSGEALERIELQRRNGAAPQLFFYEKTSDSLFSLTGELIASDILNVIYPSNEWGYAICYDQENNSYRAVAFTADKTHTVLSDNYTIASFDIETLKHIFAVQHFGNCLVVHRTDGSGVEIINVETGNKTLYPQVTVGAGVMTAKNSDESFSYLDKNGIVIMTSVYGDMVASATLSTNYCTVLISEEYNTETEAEYLHFARAGADLYSLKVEDFTITPVSNVPNACYRITKEQYGVPKYTLLSPFSTTKMSGEYDSVSPYVYNGIAWILAADYTGQKYDIVDPLTSKAVTSFACATEDFAKYEFTHDSNIALATDRYDTETTVPMTVIKLTKYDGDELVNNSRYFVLYRSSPYKSVTYTSATLQCYELGKNLLVPKSDSDTSTVPYKAFTAENYLIAYSSAGSELYSLDDSNTLTVTATIPYRVTEIISDAADSSVRYFKVIADNGMYGLYDTDSQAVLDPYYTNILSAEGGYFVVSQKDASGVIKIKSHDTKTVIDFSYRTIIPLGDHGYMAISREGDIDIYADNESILPQPVQSWKFVYRFNTNEDGNITAGRWALISAGGDLYIHRCSTLIINSVNNFTSETITDKSIPLNSRAKVIYYYNGLNLVHTDVIYHNSVGYELITAPNELGWYLEKSEDEQLIPVTVEDLASVLNSHFIRLYSKELPAATQDDAAEG